MKTGGEQIEVTCSSETPVHFSQIYGIMSQKVVLSITTAVITSNPTQNVLFMSLQFLVMYGMDRSLLPLMESLLRELCSLTLTACTGSSDAPGGGLSEYADLLEAFFILLAQILKKNPQLFVSNEGVDLAAVFQCGEFRCLFSYSVQNRKGVNSQQKSGEVMPVEQ
jgi:hypothetical protein